MVILVMSVRSALVHWCVFLEVGDGVIFCCAIAKQMYCVKMSESVDIRFVSRWGCLGSLGQV